MKRTEERNETEAADLWTQFEEMASSPDRDSRMEVAKALCQFDESRAEEMLLRLLNDSDATVRLEAADSLHEFPSPRVYEALKKVVNAREVLMRGYALRGLGDVASEEKKEETKTLLAERLRTEKNAFVRIQILLALASLGDVEAVPRLLRMYPFCAYRNRCAILNGLSDLLEDGKCPDTEALFGFLNEPAEDCVAVTSARSRLLWLYAEKADDSRTVKDRVKPLAVGDFTEDGFLSGRHIFLDRVVADVYGTVFSGDIMPGGAEEISYGLTFRGAISMFSCEYDTYFNLNSNDGGYDFVEIEDSSWLCSLPIRKDFKKSDYTHYRLYTYDKVYDIIATGYEWKFGKNT